MEQGKRRARGDEQKRERRQDILAAARGLLAERDWEAVRMEDLAAALGLVKGTLYRYFPTRQDLLAAVLREDMEAWWAEAAVRAPEGGSWGRWFAEGLAARPLLVRLVANLHMDVEAGLGEAGLRDLKIWFADFLGRAAAELERLDPALAGQGGAFLMEAYAMAVGTAQLAGPPAAVARLIAEDDALAVFRVDFREFLGAAVDRLYAARTVTGRNGPGRSTPDGGSPGARS